MAFDSTEHVACGLRILPIQDKQYKTTQLWLRSKADLDSLRNLRDCSRYVDLSFGNGHYFMKNNKPNGNPKTLRTRIRFGYDDIINKEGLRGQLHGAWSHQSRQAGCFESPLQYGSVVRTGALCFYPMGINTKTIAKDLMRHFDFKYPIGLRLDWVNQPYDARQPVWAPKSKKGVRMYHVYTRRSDASTIDRECSKWLQPITNRKDLPWAAPVHYMSDWKSAQDELISVQAHQRLSTQITKMVGKVSQFQELTEVQFVENIDSMLTPAETGLFGNQTLLKLLLSIKATPAQALLAATGNCGSSPGPTAVASEEDPDGAAGFTTVKRPT